MSLWQMLWLLVMLKGRKMLCVEQLADVTPDVADGMATVVRVDYFCLSSGVSNKMSSHICGRGYLPKYL